MRHAVVLLVATMVIAACKRAPSAVDSTDADLSGALVDATALVSDATALDARLDVDAEDAAAPNASTRAGPCDSCAPDEYCRVVHWSGGVQPIQRSTRVTCQKFASVEGGCRQRNCDCFDLGYSNQSCAVRDGRVRVDVMINAPGHASGPNVR